MPPKKKPQTPAAKPAEKIDAESLTEAANAAAAAAGDDDKDEVVEEQQTGASAQANKDMQKIAGLLDQQAGFSDEAAMTKGLRFVSTQQRLLRESKLSREKELTKVAVSKNDIQVVIDEMEMPRTAAEKALRENGGDLEATLKALVAA